MRSADLSRPGAAPARRGRRPRGVVACLAAVTALATVACSGSPSTAPASTRGSTTGPGPTDAATSGPAAAGQPVLLSPQGNDLDAYRTTPPFEHQRVNDAHKAVPPETGRADGWDINGQVCSFRAPDGALRIITGEDTNQPGVTAGWAIWDLRGTFGSLAVTRVGKLVPTYQPTPDGPDNYGCGVLPDGRIVTTDIGNDAAGDANGQLVVWFPPFDNAVGLPADRNPDRPVSFCKIDTHLATGQSIYVDGDRAIYVVSPRPSDDPAATSSGVFRYDGPFPTSADAAGGCGRTDNLGSPLATDLHKTRVLAGGANGLLAPSGLTRGPDGHWFVSSVITGVIDEYDDDWQFVRTVLTPPAGETLGAAPFSTGTPLGILAGPDGTLYYADIGIVVAPGRGPGPGDRTGSVRRIRFVDGRPQPPEAIATGLAFPDGLGLVTVP